MLYNVAADSFHTPPAVIQQNVGLVNSCNSVKKDAEVASTQQLRNSQSNMPI